jgi:hypothetical protein
MTGPSSSVSSADAIESVPVRGKPTEITSICRLESVGIDGAAPILMSCIGEKFAEEKR